MMDKVKEFAKDPRKALFTLAIPVVIATVVQTLYNIVDTAFVGRLGADALAAITFSWPLFFILIAINSGINTGMSSRISRFLGNRQKREAENAAMHGLLVSVGFALMVSVFGIIFLDELFMLFGAEGEVKALAMQYMSIILVGVVFMFTAYVLNGIFAAQGNTRTPMKIQIVTVALNGILDPIFIFAFHMGIRGAALATAIAFFIGLVWFMAAIRRKSYLQIRLKNFNFSPDILRDIIKVGMPATLMMLLISIYVIFLNRFMVYFSNMHVAAFGMATRLESVAMLPIVGFSVGLLTLVGMFYGAKKYDLLKDISWFGLKIGLLITAIAGTVFFIVPEMLLRIFTADEQLLMLAVPYLRIDVFTFPLMAASMMISRILQAMGYGLPGLIINTVRIFVVAVPLAYVFVFALGLNYLSVALAMVLGGILATAVGMVWLLYTFRKVPSKVPSPKKK